MTRCVLWYVLVAYLDDGSALASYCLILYFSYELHFGLCTKRVGRELVGLFVWWSFFFSLSSIYYWFFSPEFSSSRYFYVSTREHFHCASETFFIGFYAQNILSSIIRIALPLSPLEESMRNIGNSSHSAWRLRCNRSWLKSHRGGSTTKAKQLEKRHHQKERNRIANKRIIFKYENRIIFNNNTSKKKVFFCFLPFGEQVINRSCVRVLLDLCSRRESSCEEEDNNDDDGEKKKWRRKEKNRNICIGNGSAWEKPAIMKMFEWIFFIKL